MRPESSPAAVRRTSGPASYAAFFLCVLDFDAEACVLFDFDFDLLADTEAFDFAFE